MNEKPAKLRVRSYTVSGVRYWTWSHDCPPGGGVQEAGFATWPWALHMALGHLRRCA